MNNFRNFAVWVIIALLLVALFNLFQSPAQRGTADKVSYSRLLAEVDNGNVQEVIISGEKITGKFKGGQGFFTNLPEDANLVDRLHEKRVEINVEPSKDGVPSLISVFVSWFPMLLLIAVWIFFMRQMQSGGGKAMGFGKSKRASC